MAYKRWSDLSPRTQRLVLIGSVVEGILKIAALVDLARRPSNEVRGSKRWWAAAIVLINSVGRGSAHVLRVRQKEALEARWAGTRPAGQSRKSATVVR